MSVSGGGAASAPQTPPFNPINIPSIANAALGQDIQKYFSYNFPVFPGMTALRNSEITNAYQQLTQPLAAPFESGFLDSATTGQHNVTGGGDLYSGAALQPGSFAKGAVSSNVTRQILAKQDYDRANLEQLQSANPQPGLGLSQNDLLSLFTYNTGAANAFAMNQYANQIAQANATYGAQQQTFGAIGNAIAGLGSTYTNYNLYSNLFNSSTNAGGAAGV